MYAGQIIEVATADDFFRRAEAPLRAARCCARCPTAAAAASRWRRSPAPCRRCRQQLRRLPLRAALRPARMPQLRRPRCRDLVRGRRPGTQVRCVLYDPRARCRRQPAARSQRRCRSPSRSRRRAPTRQPATPLLDVKDLQRPLSDPRRLLQRVTGHFDAVRRRVASRSAGPHAGAGGRVGLRQDHHRQGHRAAAARPGGASTGRALLDGHATCSSCRAMRCSAARRDIQIIFQDPFASLNPRMRVRRDARRGPARRCAPRWTPASAARGIEQLADQVGLRREALERYPHEFSGGQRQRIAIARALAVQPRADRLRRADLGARRVGAGADPQPARASCSARLGVSYLFITHNIGVVEYIADRSGGDECAAASRSRAPAPRCSARRVPSTPAGCWPPCRAWPSRPEVEAAAVLFHALAAPAREVLANRS